MTPFCANRSQPTRVKKFTTSTYIVDKLPLK